MLARIRLAIARRICPLPQPVIIAIPVAIAPPTVEAR